MANLKNITELPVAESADGLNLIVNDNGAAKQIAADSVCKVKSVNGTQPDENGNVQIDTASSWNDLKDKPFYSDTDIKIAVEQQIAEFVQGDEVYQYPITLPSDIYDSKEVDILWDGVTYRIDGAELKGHDYDSPNIDGSGNSIFYIRENRGQVYIQTFDESSTHEIGITYINETVHKIDTKYLPGYAINLDSLPFANNWYSEGTETTSMSKEQWKEMVALAKDNNKMVCGNEPGIYSMFDDGEVVMTRTDVYIAKGKINVGDYEKRLTYDEEQQLCTCTYSGENLHVTGE